MNTDVLDVLVILDRSGSMQSARSDHEGGLRSFVEDQRQLAGDVRFTLVQFDGHNPCEVVYDRAKLDAVKDIALIPRGSTPLLDAIGSASAHLQKQTTNQNVVCVVITDGQENSSREWTKPRIAELVKEREVAGWTFLFLGANIDSFAEAGALGFQSSATMNFTNDSSHVRHVYAAMSSNVKRERAAAMAAPSRRLAPAARAAAYGFSAAQRARAMRPTTKGRPDGPVSGSSDSPTDEETEG